MLQLERLHARGHNKLLADVSKADPVALNEFGYVPFNVYGTRLPHQVISSTHKLRGPVFITNIKLRQ